jgi:KDO2-lipid IV(A) lauroyltransferase
VKYISYLLFRFFIFLLKILPFWLIYLISDLLSFLLRSIFGYRKQVIRTNLEKSFPSKSSEEINLIIKDVYKNLADIMVEGIKGASLNDEQVQERYKFVNPEILDQCFKDKRSVILVAGHYNNWEWAALSPPFFFKHHIVALYKRLHNKYLNAYMKTSRSNTGETLYELRDTALAFEKHAKSDKASLFLLAADQSPSNTEHAYWLNFLGRRTACLHGPEKYARQYNLPVVFSYPRRVKRGFYEVKTEWLVEEPTSLKDGEVTKAFMNRLEEIIIDDPGGWLWSHKRWKHS